MTKQHYLIKPLHHYNYILENIPAVNEIKSRVSAGPEDRFCNINTSVFSMKDIWSINNQSVHDLVKHNHRRCYGIQCICKALIVVFYGFSSI